MQGQVGTIEQTVGVFLGPGFGKADTGLHREPVARDDNRLGKSQLQPLRHGRT